MNFYSSNICVGVFFGSYTWFDHQVSIIFEFSGDFSADFFLLLDCKYSEIRYLHIIIELQSDFLWLYIWKIMGMPGKTSLTRNIQDRESGSGWNH